MSKIVSVIAGLLFLCLCSVGFANQWSLVGPTPTSIIRTSPSAGEDDVALTREFIIYLNGPVNPTTVQSSISARRGESPISFRIQTAPDGRRVTLFWDENLPASSRVTVTIDGQLMTNLIGLPVDADRNGSVGGSANIQFDTLSLTTIPGTRVVGRVFASELMDNQKGPVSLNRPLEGVRITVDGAESTLFTTTDDMGNFVLDPAPAGDFFVHVDGRTVTTDPDSNPTSYPGGPYYPFVGKKWTTSAGQEAVVGDIFLPLVAPGTLQSVSDTEDTTINLPPSVTSEFPEFSDVEIMVPAGSLYANDGTTGGMVGISPVPADRLPGALPPGLEFPIVITVQTDGATNFDVPVPACFPNLPDPATGILLVPGEKSALWSFDHDTGRFEVVGSATVSEDGMTVCTDNGVGILEPGWHGINSGSDADGNENDEDCEAACNAAAGFGALDCAASFIPGGSCAFGAAYGAGATARDCVAGALTGDRVGCGLSGALNAGGAIAGCAAKSIPGLGQGIACGGALIGLFRGCQCMFPKSAELEKGAQSGPDPLRNALQLLEANVGLMEAYSDFYVILLGSDVWVNIVDYDAPGDPRVQADLASVIMEAIGSASDPASDSGSSISMAEFNSINALPKPNNLVESDIQFTVDYINQTVIQWELDLGTHADAGRTDFMDANQYLLALDNIDLALDILDIHSGFTNDATNFSSLLLESNSVIVSEFGDSQVPMPEPSRLLFVLRDETNGNVLRGNLTGDSLFPIRVLRSDTYYREGIFDPVTFNYGSRAFYSSEPGNLTEIPAGLLGTTEGLLDSDNDGLPDVGEDVVGTFVDNPDSDDDGILDGAEVRQGLDPLNGLNARTGIIASVDTEGDALDLDIFEDLLAVGDSIGGFLLFNTFNGMQPLLIGQLDVLSRDVALEGDIAVSGFFTDLQFINIADPSLPEVFAEFEVDDNIIKLLVEGGIVYILKENNEVELRDLQTGDLIIKRTTAGLPVDIVVSGDNVYILNQLRLQIFTSLSTGFVELSRIELAKAQGTNLGFALAIDGDTAWISDSTALQTIDISDPSNPALLASSAAIVDNFMDIELNGSGNLISAGSLAGENLGNITVVDVSDPNIIPISGFEFDTPGNVASLEISNALAYAADGLSGIQVVNYESFDSNGISPTISLGANFDLLPTAQVEEGKRVRVVANVTDDVQVRNVIFSIDGQNVFDDGSFPFEYRFNTPLLSEGNSFTVCGTAFDTGGNTASTNDIVVNLMADTTPPSVVLFTPATDETLPSNFGVSLFATFNEPLDQSTLSDSTFTISGPQKQIFTGTVSYRSNSNTAVLTLPNGLISGDYTAQLAGTISDLAGNSLGTPLDFQVTVADSIDVEWLTGNGNWSDPTKWTPMIVPRSTDRALVTASESLIGEVTLDIDATVAGLVLGNGTFPVKLIANDQTLTLNEFSNITELAVLDFTESSILGSGPIENAGFLNVQDCDIDTPIVLLGGSTLNAKGTVSFDGGVTVKNDPPFIASVSTTTDDPMADVSFEGDVSIPIVFDVGVATHRMNIDVNGSLIPPVGGAFLYSTPTELSDEAIMTISAGLQVLGSVSIEAFGTQIFPMNSANTVTGEMTIIRSVFTFDLSAPGTSFTNNGEMSVFAPGGVEIVGSTFENANLLEISGPFIGDINNTGNFKVIPVSVEPFAYDFTGNYTQTDAGTTTLRILTDENTMNPATDSLNISGTAILDGKLVLEDLFVQPPMVGDSFDILTANSIVGNFSSVEIEDHPSFELSSTVIGNTVRVEITAFD